MNSVKNLIPITRHAVRQFHKSNIVCATEEQLFARRQKLKKLQEHFQIPDGTPVYLKGGLPDRLLLGATLALITVAVGMSVDTLYTLFKK